MSRTPGIAAWIAAMSSAFSSTVPAMADFGTPGASPEATEFSSNIQSYIADTREQLAGLTGPNALDACRPGTTPDAALRSCNDTYSRFYDHDNIDIRFALGYADTRPRLLVRDGILKAAIAAELTRLPCETGVQTCGFTRDPDDAEVLVKEIKGPDGRPRRVRLRLSNSATGSSDLVNRARPQAQVTQSTRSRENFMSGLREADAVFYLGHARRGAGPDFTPPRTDPVGHVDYAHYQRIRTGREDMLAGLREGRSSSRPEAERRPRFLGLFACNSHTNFNNDVQAAAPGLPVVTTASSIGDRGLLQGALGSLNGLLGMRCQSSFAGGIDAPAGSGTVRSHGLFGPPTGP